MTRKQFELVLQVITARLAANIAADSGLRENDAMNKLYTSALYAALEDEKTKIWHFSVPMLYELYKAEIATGTFELPY
jgi:hypothetical protein